MVLVWETDHFCVLADINFGIVEISDNKNVGIGTACNRRNEFRNVGVYVVFSLGLCVYVAVRLWQ